MMITLSGLFTQNGKGASEDSFGAASFCPVNTAKPRRTCCVSSRWLSHLPSEYEAGLWLWMESRNI